MGEEAIPAPPPDCWLHPAVEVRDSPIEGRGLFAAERIPRGEVVSRLGGRLVATRELHQLLEQSDHYVDTITVADDVHLVLPPRRANGYGNHSCDPNLWWTGIYELATRRDIRDGEELTNDYAASTTEESWNMPCNCGAPSCRGVVRGSDYRTTDLVQRYEHHVVPAVRAALSGR
jgi:SET domain-containing protein